MLKLTNVNVTHERKCVRAIWKLKEIWTRGNEQDNAMNKGVRSMKFDCNENTFRPIFYSSARERSKDFAHLL